ncbi:dihydropteridine reductase, putative [Ixodes scapularis]|uniref:Dihydropteridine reductase, putative n=1 Tax=Ixodes scapularis TaxID=6945 RepID=B7QAP3_IXOSC|nr:dihydropteridine reductase, putative [Ixodes scapularis]|eukprot:XP_002412619.1 dihydropteridine reductase, putative [Ixodes scapularis]
MASTAGRVLVYGGKGALGSSIVSLFRQHKWWVGCVDHFANEEADANIFVESSDSWTKQHDAVLQAVAKALQVVRLSLAFLLQNPSFSLTPKKGFSSPLHRRLTSCSTSYIIIVHASQHYGDAAHSCLVPYTRECLFRRRQPSKFAVYSWQQIIRGIGRPEFEHGPAITLRSGSLASGTLDTPANRNAMPKANFGSWTPLSFVAETLFKWTSGSERPSSGSLVQLETKEGNTSLTIASPM